MINPLRKHHLTMRLILLTLICLLSSGCSYLLEKQSSKFANRMSDTMLNFEDPATVGAAMPTFLIIIDSIARDEDAGSGSLLAAAKIYGAYAGAFVAEPERQRILSEKAFAYAQRGVCAEDKHWCGIQELKPAEFSIWMQSLDAEDIDRSYAFAVAWLGYIQSHSDDWNAVADLSKARQLLEMVARQDPAYDHASVQLYLGAIATILPPALGGKPEQAKQYFEQGMTLSHGRNLLIPVEYARRYARLLFDQELHHQLLTQVVEADPEEPGLTLMNRWAQQEAGKLLAGEAEYFE